MDSHELKLFTPYSSAVAFSTSSFTSPSVTLILLFGCREKLSHYEPRRSCRGWETFQMAGRIFNMCWDLSLHILWVSLQMMLYFSWSCCRSNTHVHMRALKHTQHLPAKFRQRESSFCSDLCCLCVMESGEIMNRCLCQIGVWQIKMNERRGTPPQHMAA